MEVSYIVDINKQVEYSMKIYLEVFGLKVDGDLE